MLKWREARCSKDLDGIAYPSLWRMQKKKGGTDMNVKHLLQNWGAWSRCRIGTEYPPVSLGMLDAVRWSQNSIDLTFTDEVALPA